ncbi:Uncharacterised protein [uncultured archaeon]|nr:Uncharacterised protein [uncultured archaeon]
MRLMKPSFPPIAALAVAVVLLALSFGCTSLGSNPKGNQSGQGAAPGSNLSISIPRASVPYTAHYVVQENGKQSEKTIWRLGNNLKLAMGDSSVMVELYFLGDKAYSCSTQAEGAACYDVTGKLSGFDLSSLVPSPGPDAVPDEIATIGSTRGQCYLEPLGVVGMMKRCFTDRGVLAYEERNQTQSQTYVEYLTDLAYSASESDFALPATPQQPPE